MSARHRNAYDFRRACIYAADQADDTGYPHLVFWGGPDDGYLVLSPAVAQLDDRVWTPNFLAVRKPGGRGFDRNWL